MLGIVKYIVWKIEDHIPNPPAVVASIPIYSPADVGIVGFPLVIVHDRVWQDPFWIYTVPCVACV